MQEENDTHFQPLITGPELRALRKAKGIGLRELARLTGLTPTTISAYETGLRTGIRVKTFAKIMEVLDPEKVSAYLAPEPTPSAIPGIHILPVIRMKDALRYDPILHSIEDLLAKKAQEYIPYPFEMLLNDPEGKILHPVNRNAIFALRIEGEYMAPTLHDGDLVAVANCLPGIGNPTIVHLLGKGLMIKRWMPTEDKLELQSLEPDGQSYSWTREQFIGKELILWRWSVYGILWRKLR